MYFAYLNNDKPIPSQTLHLVPYLSIMNNIKIHRWNLSYNIFRRLFKMDNFTFKIPFTNNIYKTV